ncbi:AAA domain-containing protein [Lophiotrema nucula]|uniref:DNA repair protein RAD50 n=1 Tax=Lophiotrema nucula TaxID=690887 RepID=A0A6A5Z155_9PLEO|nr:AAA domain-containing protein [Lophiotrema nucula]
MTANKQQVYVKLNPSHLKRWIPHNLSHKESTTDFTTAKIDKLQIVGVRSFANRVGETIQFGTPLTLIVGWNGSGKTTIIECLKYATTGELPPNSKTGGAFIHDPKLCGEKEVLAQVMLAFKSTSGVRMVATRRLQLTVKKTTRSQKTLEGSLVIAKDGERTAISARVAELDQIIPQYLGVSKAILENVIFCHQDDSLWPMSEPSVLKKKFDEIFEAMKYTKAIENIKILRKKQNEELAKCKIIEQHCKEDKEKGERAEKKGSDLYDEIEELKVNVGESEAKERDARTKATEAFNHAARFEQIIAQLNGKRITFAANQESAADLEANIKQMAESDEELQSMLDQYEERVAMHHNQQQTSLKQYNGLKNELAEARESLGVKQGEIGKFQAEKEQHDHNLRQRETLVKEAAKRHDIRNFDYDLSEEQIADFLDIVGKKSRDQDRKVDTARSETEQKLRKAQASVNQLNERKAALNQSKEMSRSQITSNDKRISDLQKTMDRIKVDEGGEAILRERMNEIEQRLKSARSTATSERLDERIREAESLSRTLEEQKEALEAELIDATKAARDSAQIGYAQDELKATHQSLQTMKGVHGSRFTQLIEPDWDPVTLEASFQQVLSQKTAKVKEAESRREIAQTKLDGINFKLSNLESEQKKKRAELQKYEKAVKEAIGQDDISEFNDVLQDLEERYDIASADNAKFAANVEYMKAALQTAEEHNQCRLCQRALKDNKAEHFTRDGFLSRLEGFIERAAKMQAEEDVKALQTELEDARNAKPSFDLANQLRGSELPTLQSELKKLAAERETVNKQLEDQDAVIYDLQAEKQEVESISKDVQSTVGYYNQGHDLEAKIRDLTEKQKAAGLSRSLDSIQEDSKKVSDKIRSSKATLSRLSTDREKSRTEINSLELKVRDTNAELRSAQTELKEKRTLADRIQEFKTHNGEQRESIRRYDTELQGLNPQIETAQGVVDDINRRGHAKIQELQDEAGKLASTTQQLSYIAKQINAYIDKGGLHQLSRAHRDIENLQGEMGRLEDEMTTLTRQLKRIEEALRNTDDTKRAINDNIRYRKAKRALQTLQAEIEELESHNAEQDNERYTQDGQKWQNEVNRLSTVIAGDYATIATKDKALKEILDEWDTDYKEAAYKYREAHIKVETTKAAVEDLGRYGGALDKAIMKYHTLKMEEINCIVEELWRQSYQGTDVDTIRIRSDNETGKGNRSYNYRVVMVKQEVEMDMRGRCSAGQKVLASIVIRLALAECFGTNCGLIALDEPTTNLDQQNIKGLAESLSEIIKARRKQANFQLIVITHDEQFLRDMDCADYTEHYWRVGRNPEQKSVIRRQYISDVSHPPLRHSPDDAEPFDSDDE